MKYTRDKKPSKQKTLIENQIDYFSEKLNVFVIHLMKISHIPNIDVVELKNDLPRLNTFGGVNQRIGCSFK